MYIRTLFVLLLATVVSAQKTILALKPTFNATAAITLDYIDPPANIVLNTRDFPIKVAFANVPDGEVMDVHVDLIGDGGYTWFGGGLVQVTGPAGEATIPIEVRVPSYYGGNLSVHAFVTPAGGGFEQRVANAPELEVGIDHTPVNAIGVLCQPRQVQPGTPFTVNLWFTQTHARPMDLIAVALNADTKDYLGGFQVPVKEQQGHVSGAFNLHATPLDTPVKFKAWLSPRGEVAPNYVTYTMLNIPLGPAVVQPCNPDPTNEWTQTGLPQASWVELHDVPKVVSPGEKLTLRLVYNLRPEDERIVNATVAMFTWDWKTHEANEIVAAKAQLPPVFEEALISLTIPTNAQSGPDGIFFVASLAGMPGVEDRVYQVALDGPMPIREAEVLDDAQVIPAATAAPAAHMLRHGRQ